LKAESQAPARLNRRQADINGQDFEGILHAGERWLSAHVDVVNSLNVFPVPDGDTGTNMMLTLRAALSAANNSPDKRIGGIAAAVADGALMGARGNSGVILSQILRGLAKGFEGKERSSVAEFAAATGYASELAYKGVVAPVEGTILTVIRETAAAAQRASHTVMDMGELLESMTKAARLATARTPDLLPILKEAGVVDAGGQGLFYILEGGLRFLAGEAVDFQNVEREPAALTLTSQPQPGEYGYDVQFLIHGHDLDIDAIRASIDALGNSTMVVGDERLVKVHVHVQDPGLPLSYGVRQGIIGDVVIENMDEQHGEFVKSRQSAAARTEKSAPIGIVCVAPGDGFRRILTSLGADSVVTGGQTLNPSTEELLAAVERVPAKQVLLLPNNPNVILSAQQVPNLADKSVLVVPTRTVPQGISALLAFNMQVEPATNAERMLAAAQEIETIEITRAVRTTTLEGTAVNQGDLIGILNEMLVSTGAEAKTVVLDALKHLDVGNYEIAAIYFGSEVTAADAEQLANQLRDTFPNLEVEILAGGQAHHPFILSLE
jgi:uncharacterized protein